MNAFFSLRNVENSMPYLMPDLQQSTRILDVGCGIGSITLDLAKRCSQGHVTGIDINEDSIMAAKAEAKRVGVANVDYQVGNAYNLDAFNAESFDIVISHQLHLHLQHPVKALQQMRRVTKPGGIITIKDNFSLLYIGCSDLVQRYKLIMETYMYKDKDGKGGQRNHEWMNEAGFSWDSLQTGVLAWQFSHKNGLEEWCAGAKAQSAAFRGKTGTGTEEELKQLLEDYDTWKDSPFGRVIGVDGWVVARA